MGFSLWNLFKSGLLLINAVLILHRKRFLAKYGLDDITTMGYNAEEMPMRAQLIGLLHAVQYLKFPVIIANCITIVFEMLLGGS
mmetsp:Transcript_22805/g.26259  ORF Transcript_22805/g.26259 Transcript_22805/m.26259 type:complete len:84 (-) Transcript_22805:358-609(-)